MLLADIYEIIASHGLLSIIDNCGITSFCCKDFVRSSYSMQKQIMRLGPAGTAESGRLLHHPAVLIKHV